MKEERTAVVFLSSTQAGERWAEAGWGLLPGWAEPHLRLAGGAQVGSFRALKGEPSLLLWRRGPASLLPLPFLSAQCHLIFLTPTSWAQMGRRPSRGGERDPGQE